MIADRVAEKIDASGPCWLWTGAILNTGYGQSWDSERRRPVSAHRHVYERMIGTIPDGLHLDHLCRVRHCVNPDHLEPVTPQENARRARRGMPDRSALCIRGHDDWRVDPDGFHRRCRTCARDALREWKKRRAA